MNAFSFQVHRIAGFLVYTDIILGHLNFKADFYSVSEIDLFASSSKISKYQFIYKRNLKLSILCKIVLLYLILVAHNYRKRVRMF